MIPISAESAGSAEARLVVAEAALAVALAEAENLRAALVSSRVIGAAVGIVMARQVLPYDAAFEAQVASESP